MNKIDIQPGLTGGYDVIVNRDHHGHCTRRDDAIAMAREAANPTTLIRDFTTMGEGRTAHRVPFAVVSVKP